MRDLVWDDLKLYFGRQKVGEITPDDRYPAMWRVVLPNGLSDMVNRARAKDACGVIIVETKRRGAHSPLGARGCVIPAEAMPCPT